MRKNQKPPLTSKKATKPLKLVQNKDGQILLDETLFRDRQVFLHCQVGQESCDFVMTQLRVLDRINHDPIYLHINSPGGYVAWGFALIDVIKSLKSKVIAIGSGTIASMASVIFISCPERHAHKNTTFMFHDMFSGVVDYAAKMEARMDFQKKEWMILRTHIKDHTKLSEKELEDMRSGELWLLAEDAVKKGVADKII